MRFESIRALPGPNVYVHRPVLWAVIELAALTERETHQFPGFVAPARATARPARSPLRLGAPGGFVERLEGGTYFGHTVEHVAIELQNLVGVSVNLGKTLYAARRAVTT